MLQLFINIIYGMNFTGPTLINLAMLIGFLINLTLVVYKVYSPSNVKKYLEESMIPLDDDTPEEKQALSHTVPDKRRSYRLDA